MARILRRHERLRPHLEIDRGAHPPEALVLLVHGGPERGFSEAARWGAPYLRMLPFGRAVREVSGGRIAVVRLRHRHNGWNGGEASTVGEARWALGDLAEQAPGLPLGVLGHSLGGRTALAVADHPAVRAVVALAPWLPPGEPVEPVRGRSVLLLQGEADRICPARDARAYLARARAAGLEIEAAFVPATGHLMVRRARECHTRAADFLTRSLLAPAS